jgi:hypothetical protein
MGHARCRLCEPEALRKPPEAVKQKKWAGEIRPFSA